MSAELDYILTTLAEHGDGLDRRELLLRLRQRWPNLVAEQLERYLALAGNAITERDGRLFAPSSGSAEDESSAEPRTQLRRFVAIDLESVVQPIVEAPYRRQHVFQIGAIRFGPDQDWVAEQSSLNLYMELPGDEQELLIHRDDVRTRYLARKLPAPEALEALREMCAGADALVAYNGIAHDFPLIQLEFARAELPAIFEMQRRTGPS